MIVTCPDCGWRYLRHRVQVHVALHDLLSHWPCAIRSDFGSNLTPYCFNDGVHLLLEFFKTCQLHLCNDEIEIIIHLIAENESFA